MLALDPVEPFVESCPPEDIGCLYYSASKHGFVDPRQVTDAVPHFGRPGGVLPRVAAIGAGLPSSVRCSKFGGRDR